jgi:serine protease inhibitor
MNEKSAAQASDAFGWALTQAVAKTQPKQNLFLSPLSVFIALAMTANGASAETRKAILTGLHLPDELSQSNAACSMLFKSLTEPEPKVTLELAQALWAFAPYQFAPKVLAKIQAAFDAELHQTSFQHAAPEINDWAAKKTHGMIKNVVGPKDFDELTVCALSNATYFKGIWTNVFDPADTRPMPFHCHDGTISSVPMMKSTQSLELARTPEYLAVRVPYSSGRFQLHAYLPEGNQTPESILPKLQSAAPLVFDPMKVELSFPKFILDLPVVDLKDTVSTMGLLGPNDLSPMMLNGGSEFLDKIMHKTRLEIDEAGTRAAAVTVEMAVRSIGPRTVNILFDRPFVLCLVDTKTQVTLFTGIIHNPA